jgi:hypothetical protein
MVPIVHVKLPFENDMPGMKTMNRTKVTYSSNGSSYETDEVFYPEKPRNIGYSEKEIEDFCYGNATRLLGLDKV